MFWPLGQSLSEEEEEEDEEEEATFNLVYFM
jgi:hypothetical protein